MSRVKCRPVYHNGHSPDLCELGGHCVPRCSGHDEPMKWFKDVRCTSGGFWGCATQRRESWRRAQARYRQTYRGWRTNQRKLAVERATRLVKMTGENS